MIKPCDPEDVCTKASAALASSSIRDLRSLHVRHDEGSLKVSGSVGSFYHKQIALETVRSVARGFDIRNTVRVS